MKRICVVTGSRADYGPMRPLLKALQDAEDFDMQLRAVADHYVQGTLREIEQDGFGIERSHDARHEATLILGDRSEILTVAVNAYQSSTPLIHLYGGERTDGSRDDARRHAITKLADLHFVAAEPYRERVIQLGEDPERVFTVGALAVDTALSLQAQGYAWEAEEPNDILCTFHPCEDDPCEMLAAFDMLPDLSVSITAPNSDPGSEELTKLLTGWCEPRPRARFYHSLGQDRYLWMMRGAQCVVGNSSSALIEAPALGVPSVNIGSRQAGRLKARSVLDCDCAADAIVPAIKIAMNPSTRTILLSHPLPYGGGGGAQKILDVLRRTDFSQLGIKRFRDL